MTKVLGKFFMRKVLGPLSVELWSQEVNIKR